MMEANYYVENTALVGHTMSFGGMVLVNNFVPGYTSQAFIKVLDSNNGWALVGSAYAPLVNGQLFSLQLDVANTPGLIPQYGFMTTGAVANPATVGALGFAMITTPEPASLALLLGALALVSRRR
jgi:hypothetical protein